MIVHWTEEEWYPYVEIYEEPRAWTRQADVDDAIVGRYRAAAKEFRDSGADLLRKLMEQSP